MHSCVQPCVVMRQPVLQRGPPPQSASVVHCGAEETDDPVLQLGQSDDGELTDATDVGLDGANELGEDTRLADEGFAAEEGVGADEGGGAEEGLAAEDGLFGGEEGGGLLGVTEEVGGGGEEDALLGSTDDPPSPPISPLKLMHSYATTALCWLSAPK